MQMSVAIKKILYADDPNESALEEAQDYLNQTLNAVEAEAEAEIEAWLHIQLNAVIDYKSGDPSP